MNEQTMWVELEQAVRNIKAYYVDIPSTPPAPPARIDAGCLNVYLQSKGNIFHPVLGNALAARSAVCLGTYHITVLSDGSDPQIARVKE